MIEEQAQVIDIKGHMLILQAQTQSACGSCAASKGCGTSLLSKVVGRKFTRIQADNSINANIGDTVVVGIAEDAMLKGSMILYLFPVLGMFVIALLADYLVSPALQYRDLVIAATAFGGLLGGASVARSYFTSYSSAKSFTPVVLRKIIK